MIKIIGLFLIAGSLSNGSNAGETVTNEAIPVENFFKKAQVNQAALSPNGEHVAMLVANSNDRLILAVVDVKTSQTKILAQYSNTDIGAFHWVNNQRLVYDLVDRQTAQGNIRAGSGLYAVDIDGKNARELIRRHLAAEPPGQRILSIWHKFHDVIREKDTNDIYVTKLVSSGSKSKNSFNLLRLNTLTGQNTLILQPGDVQQWLVDETGAPRIVTTLENSHLACYLKDDKTGKWSKLFDSIGSDEDAVTPSFFGPDGVFYVTALNGKDKRSLYVYDLKKNKIGEDPVISLDGYDYNATPIFNGTSKSVLGFKFDTDAPGTLWLNAEYKKIQEKIDKRLPGMINQISVSTEVDTDFVLVDSFSDIDPGNVLVYNHRSEKLTLLGKKRPWINPQQMAYQDFLKYKARDGLEIPAYLTLPRGKNKNLPLVVLIHGGPFVRGEHWGWNSQVQFLASRGYAVLQPEFRGSTGYGTKHHKLGWKQWGLKMQDDITDGTKWVIAQGIADPKRICLAGASYGGYATLWGLIKEHDLYQCGISWVGVTDIGFLYNIAWSDFNSDTEKYYLPTKVADLEKDAEQIRATSPVEHANKLTRPLILAYGGSDKRVPIEHGNRLMKVLETHNSQVEWIVYPEEGHGWSQLNNNVDFWGRVDKFLDKHIGKGQIVD